MIFSTVPQEYMFAAVLICGILCTLVVIYYPARRRFMVELEKQTHASLLLEVQLTGACENIRLELQHKTRRCEELIGQGIGLQDRILATSNQVAALGEKVVSMAAIKSQLSNAEQRILAFTRENSQLQTALDLERENIKQQQKILEHSKIELSKEFENTANKIFDTKNQQFSQSSQVLLENTLSPFKVQLTDFKKKVEDVYERENSERSRLSGQIIELQKQAHKISEDAVSLAQALKGNNKMQGGWGEIVLERLLEQSGLQKGREYETQISFKAESGTRRIPDVVVHLPENKDIIIDAKVSLTSYEKYCNCDDEKEREGYLQQHVHSMRSHINGLSIKEYEGLPGINTLDFVFIFVPIEAAFMLALQYEPGLYKEAYDKNVILSSPTTLLAILRMVDNIWRYEKQNNNAEQIAREAGSLHDQFILVVEAMENVGGYIEKTHMAYKLAHKRLSSGKGNLLKRVNNLREMGAKTKKQIDPKSLQDTASESAVQDLNRE